MRTRFKPTECQRRACKADAARLLEPRTMLEVFRRAGVPWDFRPTEATCRLESAHPDRFVLRVDLRVPRGPARAYAVKVYADDFGARVWRHCGALAGHALPPRGSLSLPSHFIREERMLLFPWIDGPFLSEISDGRKPELLRDVARLAAHLHGLPIVPEAETTVPMLLDEVSERCERLGTKWPRARALVAPFPDLLREAAACLDPAPPALVHGDMASGQFLVPDGRPVLLDPDAFGYTDPAYDAGHFLAQQERRCLLDPEVRDHAGEWLAAFGDTYHDAMPRVSRKNVSFYRGLTFVRKMYTLCRRDPARGPDEVRVLADRARHVLRQVLEPAP